MTLSIVNSPKTFARRNHNVNPYGGLNLATPKSRKLGVFGQKLERSHSSFVDISMNIRETVCCVIFCCYS